MTIHEALKEQYVRDVEFRNLRVTPPGHPDLLIALRLQYRIQREAGHRGWSEWMTVPVVTADQEDRDQ